MEKIDSPLYELEGPGLGHEAWLQQWQGLQGVTEGTKEAHVLRSDLPVFDGEEECLVFTEAGEEVDPIVKPLGHQVRYEGTLSVAEAIRRMDQLAADSSEEHLSF